MSNIIYIKGNLLTSDCDIIAHGCNCHCIMGAGIAKQIKEKFPKAYAADLATIHNKDKLGTFSWAKENNKIICNLYTQQNYGRGLQVDYKAVKSCFWALFQWIPTITPTLKGRQPKIGIPKIGAGLGGGNWDVIAGIIEEESQRPVYCYYL